MAYPRQMKAGPAEHFVCRACGLCPAGLIELRRFSCYRVYLDPGCPSSGYCPTKVGHQGSR